MKKRILSFITALFVFGFSVTCCYCQPVYASMPGIVEASVLWEGWETLGLILGVTTEFNDNLTISKNNEIQYQYYYDKINNDSTLSSAEKSSLIAELDNTRLGFADRVINISSSLWSWITKITYDDKIQTTVNLYPYLTNYQQTVFNSWSGRCLIVYPALLGGESSVIIFKGDGLYSTPNLLNTYGDGSRLYGVSSGGTLNYVLQGYNSISTTTSNYTFRVAGGSALSWQFIENKTINQVFEDTNNDNSLVGSPSWQDYIDGITGNFSILDGSLVDVNTGDAPIVLDGEALDNTISAIQDGTLTYDQAIDQAFENTDTGEITDFPSPISKKALDELIGGLNIDRVQNKFPFCIPHDLQLIMQGATAVSSNSAPVIEVPLHIEYNGTVYFDSDRAIVIDFNMFNDIIPIFREGFFLLFLVGLLWLSIEVMQAFFVVTE